MEYSYISEDWVIEQLEKTKKYINDYSLTFGGAKEAEKCDAAINYAIKRLKNEYR